MGDIIILLILVALGIAYFVQRSRMTPEEREQSRKTPTNKKGEVICPHCGSTQISANKRGITFSTGLLGSQIVYITCLKCGYRWRAGKR